MKMSVTVSTLLALLLLIEARPAESGVVSADPSFTPPGTLVFNPPANFSDDFNDGTYLDKWTIDPQSVGTAAVVSGELHLAVGATTLSHQRSGVFTGASFTAQNFTLQLDGMIDATSTNVNGIQVHVAQGVGPGASAVILLCGTAVTDTLQYADLCAVLVPGCIPPGPGSSPFCATQLYSTFGPSPPQVLAGKNIRFTINYDTVSGISVQLMPAGLSTFTAGPFAYAYTQPFRVALVAEANGGPTASGAASNVLGRFDNICSAPNSCAGIATAPNYLASLTPLMLDGVSYREIPVNGTLDPATAYIVGPSGSPSVTIVTGNNTPAAGVDGTFDIHAALFQTGPSGGATLYTSLSQGEIEVFIGATADAYVPSVFVRRGSGNDYAFELGITSTGSQTVVRNLGDVDGDLTDDFATFVFSGVTTAGNTTVTVLDSCPAPYSTLVLPGTEICFTLGTTAVFGSVTVTLPYKDGGSPNAKIFKGVDDVTGTVDTGNSTVTSIPLASLSPFTTGLSAVVPASVRIEPQRLNLGAEGVFTAFVRLPNAFSPTDIVGSTVTANGVVNVRTQVAAGELVAKFDRKGLAAVLPPGAEGPLTLSVEGQLVGGQTFSGSTSIQIVQ